MTYVRPFSQAQSETDDSTSRQGVWDISAKSTERLLDKRL